MQSQHKRMYPHHTDQLDLQLDLEDLDSRLSPNIPTSFENQTKRFGNGTKPFEDGMFLRCSSALQCLYEEAFKPL